MRHKGTFRLFKLVAALSIAAVMAPAVIGAGVAAGAAAKGSPLTFGIVGTNTGQFSIPQEGQAFEAYVANWNAHGGYKGHPIRVIDIDGGLDPSETGDAAHTLVSSDDVIGMVGNYAFLDCSVNNSFYQANHVADLGGGVSGCYIPNIDFPETKLGGSMYLSGLVKYAAQTGSKHIGLVSPSFSTLQQVINASTAQAKASHVQFTTYGVSPFATAADFDATLSQMKAAGVDTVISLSQASQGELLLQEAIRQNFGPANHVRIMYGPEEYNPTLSSAIAGTYVYTVGYPWTSSQGQQALKVLQHSGVKVSVYDGIAQNGYQAASEFQQVLDSVKGPVTRASFLAAAERATSLKVALTPGFTVNLVHPGKDTFGGFVVKAKTSGFKLVSGFIVTKF